MKLLTEVSQNSNQVYWCWSNTKWCSWKSYSSFPEMPQSCSHSWLTASREISENQIYHSSVTDGQMRSQGISTQMPRYTSHMRGVKSVPICSMVPTVRRQCLVHNMWLHFSLGGKNPAEKYIQWHGDMERTLCETSFLKEQTVSLLKVTNSILVYKNRGFHLEIWFFAAWWARSIPQCSCRCYSYFKKKKSLFFWTAMHGEDSN